MAENDPPCLRDALGATKKRMPPETYAIMVHRQFEIRAREFLLDQQPNWIVVGASEANVKSRAASRPTDQDLSSECRKRSRSPTLESGDDASGDVVDRSRFEVLDDQASPGLGKDRQGYILLLLKGITCSKRLQELHPMARQNISWCSPISHQQVESAFDETVGQSRLTLGSLLLDTLVNEYGFQLDKDSLRVDAYPREKIQFLCLSIQQAAAAMTGTSEFDTYEGPVSMTMSASRCSHRLTVIFVKDKMKQAVVMWGVSQRSTKETSRCMDLALNHDANREIQMLPADSLTGVDLPTSGPKSPDAPISRAYYKLKEVWDDLLLREPLLCADLARETGLDLGSAPGGWTQCLSYSVGMSRVLSVDISPLAQRVMVLPQVTHFLGDLTSKEAANDIASVISSDRPLSLVVCDASIVAYKILDSLLALIKHMPRRGMFALPCAWVITLKLPHKRKNSIRRQLTQARDVLPSQLSRVALYMYGESRQVKIRYHLRHLMANSEAERTLLAIFEET